MSSLYRTVAKAAQEYRDARRHLLSGCRDGKPNPLAVEAMEDRGLDMFYRVSQALDGA